MKTLHISAGGRGERIAAYIASIAPFMPKHLLPIPGDGKTILGEIIFSAHNYFDEIKVWASTENYPQISLKLEKLAAVKVVIDKLMKGSLGPMVGSVVSRKHRTYACAGDFYCDFSWKDFEKFHESHKSPVSVLVAHSAITTKGARFTLDNSKISKWERVERTTAEDLINIGCYIIDPEPEIVDLLNAMPCCKEDDFFDSLIPKKLVAGYDPGVIGFNVNTAEVYRSLLGHLAAHTMAPKEEEGGNDV